MIREPAIVYLLGVIAQSLDTAARQEERTLEVGAGVLHRFPEDHVPEPLRQKPLLRIVK